MSFEGQDLESLSSVELLRLFARVMTELRSRGVVRGANNPVADYAEGLVAAALGLSLVAKSSTGHDAVDADGRRYEIKGRRPTKENPSAQSRVVRGLDAKHFDFLVGVVFNEDFSVSRAS